MLARGKAKAAAAAVICPTAFSAPLSARDFQPAPLTLSIGGAQVSCSHREGNSSFGGRKHKFIVARFKGHGHRACPAGLASNAIGELWDEEVSLRCGGMMGF